MCVGLPDENDADALKEGDFAGPAPAPRTPCLHGPGSREKVDIMTLRAARGECLFHPADAGEFDGQLSRRLEDEVLPPPVPRVWGRTATVHRGWRQAACGGDG
jgi:hypothetical protein